MTILFLRMPTGTHSKQALINPPLPQTTFRTHNAFPTFFAENPLF